MRDLPFILNGIAFVFVFQQQSFESASKQLLADMNGDNLFAELNREDKSRRRVGEGGNQSRARDSKRQKNENQRSSEYTDLDFKTMLEKIKLSVAHLR